VLHTPFPGSPANPGYTLSQLGNQHTYYFSRRGEFRTDDLYSTDVSLGYSIRVFKSLELFLRGSVTNVFNNDAVIFPDTTVITRRSGGAGSNLVAFNPLTDTPIECTQRDPANPNRCAVSGANWMRVRSSGRPTASALTTPGRRPTPPGSSPGRTPSRLASASNSE
jgi:hypothetical protein